MNEFILILLTLSIVLPVTTYAKKIEVQTYEGYLRCQRSPVNVPKKVVG